MFSAMKRDIENEVTINMLREALTELSDARNVEQKRVRFLEREQEQQRLELASYDRNITRAGRLIKSQANEIERLKLQLKALQTPMEINLVAEEEEIDSFEAFLDREIEESVKVNIREKTPELEPVQKRAKPTNEDYERWIDNAHNSREAREGAPFTLMDYQRNLDREYEKNLNQQHNRMKDLHKASKRAGRVGRIAKKALQFYE
jgi:hypothetical protein